jgi:hypothetical protein
MCAGQPFRNSLISLDIVLFSRPAFRAGKEKARNLLNLYYYNTDPSEWTEPDINSLIRNRGADERHLILNQEIAGSIPAQLNSGTRSR